MTITKQEVNKGVTGPVTIDYPIVRLDPAGWDRGYLLDVAAAATVDSRELVGHRDLVEALCRDYGLMALELQTAGVLTAASQRTIHDDLVALKARLELESDLRLHSSTEQAPVPVERQLRDDLMPLKEHDLVSLVLHCSARPIHDFVCSGQISAEQGARLLEVRLLHAWRRRPWWERLIARLFGEGPWSS